MRIKEADSERKENERDIERKGWRERERVEEKEREGLGRERERKIKRDIYKEIVKEGGKEI